MVLENEHFTQTDRPITMRIWQQLKNLRGKRKMTLNQLSEKVGYGTGNLSSYETGKLEPKDTTLLRILTRGYDFSVREAKNLLAHWRQLEVSAKYDLTGNIAQSVADYNARGTKHLTLEEFLRQEGLDDSSAKKIKKMVEEYKKERKK